MGTKVQHKNYLADYNSMRDINEDSNSSSWPRFYGEKPISNGLYYNNFTPRNVTNSYPAHNKDVLKQKMLEHEAIFKNQVSELHRLYRIQRDMMEEIKRKEHYKHQISVEASSSSRPYQIQSDQESHKWHISSLPLSNPGCSRPSIVGTSDVINSPLSCTKRTIPLQNLGVLQDTESSRPSKIRKKLFDLQLPAYEYIDPEDGEQVQENKDNNKTKLFLGGKIECQVDNLKPNLRGPAKVADLNEPVQIEPSVDFVGRSAYRGRDLSAKWKSPFLGLTQETVSSSKSGGATNNLSVENKGNGREWLSNMHDAGSNKSNMSPSKSNMSLIPQCLQPDKQIINSHIMQTTPNRGPNHHRPNQPFGVFSSENSRGEMWGEKKGRVPEISDRIQERSNYSNNLESVLGSRISSSYPFVNNSSDFANSWSHSVSSWGNPSSNFNQKLTSVQRQPSFNSYLSRNSQPLDPTHDIIGDSWHVSGSCRSNRVGLASELPIRNGSNFMDFKSDKDKAMNLNAFPPDSSNEAVETRIMSQKDDSLDQLAVLPWLRSKLVVSTEPVSTNFIDLNSSNHCTPEEFEDMKTDVKHGLIDINVACDALGSDSAEASCRKNSKLATCRNIIDLNLCASEDEDQSSPSYAIDGGGTKIRVEIDLEADPVDSESEEQVKQDEHDTVRTAAEAILTISSAPYINEADTRLEPCEASMADSLLLLFEAVDVSYDNLVKETVTVPTVEIDYFEAMTLQLAETKKEDYLPNFTLLKIQETEETGRAPLPTRPRRGQARRGRQRRDFQRDILPGLTALSRHEITEDIQTFGGLMRATGHNWPVGSTRRNGVGRPRRRTALESAVPPPPLEPPVVHSITNLTGWGKTRRPRRQRCAAGNAIAVALT